MTIMKKPGEKKPKQIGKPRKATKAESMQRVAKVKHMLIMGKRRPAIIQFAKENWDIGENQVDKYLRMATDEMEDAANATYETNRKKILAGLWAAYHLSVETLDKAEQRQMLKTIADLTGLTKININLNVEKYEEYSDDELLEDAMEEGAGLLTN